MNSTKAHIAALSLLDRAFIATTDDEMKALLAGLPEDHVLAIMRISGIRDEDAGAPAAEGEARDIDDSLIEAVRVAANKGRLNGDLQRLGVVMSDACLADCVTELGDAADLPGEEDLQKVMPGLVDKHGLGVVRMMLASTVVGEAPASATIVGMLKNDELVKLPPLEQKPLAPLLPLKENDAERQALRDARKARKMAQQAEAKARREQHNKARNRA